MNYTRNDTWYKLDGDGNPTLVQNLEDLRACLNLVNAQRNNKNTMTDAGFTDDITNAIKDPTLNLVAGAWGFMGNMFSKFENLAEAMLDTTATLIVTLRICAVIAIVAITMIIVWKFWKTCNKCANPCKKSSKKSSRDDVAYTNPMKLISSNNRPRKSNDIVGR